MNGLDDFAEGLQQEVVSEIADNYFGARKSLDEMIEALDSWASELNRQVERIGRVAGNLHSLFLDQRQCRDLYSAIGVNPDEMPLKHGAFDSMLMPSVPFAFTGAGRYSKWVFAAYRELAKFVDVYLNGEYYVDPEDSNRRKHLTVHYIRFRTMVDFVNEHIDRVNERMASGDTLRYVKSMDPAFMEKEKTLDAGMENYQTLSQGMRYEPIVFEDYGIPEYPHLPAPDTVRDEILHFAGEVYRNHKSEVVRLLRDRTLAMRSD